MKKFASDWIERNIFYKRIADADGMPHYTQVERRVIVCLCGSTRFPDAFIEANKNETLQGKIVLSVGLYGHKENIDMAGPTKAMLDGLHFDKISLADEVLILNVDGYVGSSTRNEVLFAERLGKIIRWMEPFKVPPDLARIGNSLSDGPGTHRDSDNDPDKTGA